ncbi:MAG: hypothetical protein U5L10_03705 [Candidatus Moranbacteria bacterium]|nr:hypothetical protein [Candidatus Moranbacteria bacterium]
MKTKIKIILSAVLVLLVAIVFQVELMKKIEAAEFLNGWIWGGSEEANDGTIDGNETGVGWLSVNSKNCDSDLDGTTDQCGNNCDTDGDDVYDDPCPIASYGVQIPAGDGDVTGYAWSSNLGWIDFNPQDHCGVDYQASSCTPDSGNAGVTRSGSQLLGWARIVGIAQESADGNSGGWDGWIKMSGTVDDGAGTQYGVDINSLNNDSEDLNGDYAWSNELGYIDFEEIIPPDIPQFKVCDGDTWTDNGVTYYLLNKNPNADNHPQVDLNAYYAESSQELNCSNTTTLGASNVDSDSDFTPQDGSITMADEDQGIVESKNLTDINGGDRAEVKVDYTNSSTGESYNDTANICIYDCSGATSNYFVDNETYDCGCGVEVNSRRARGEGWREVAP